jgi:hypothetical protein
MLTMALEKKEIFNFKVEPSVIVKAKKKAEKEKMTLAERLRKFLIAYIK